MWDKLLDRAMRQFIRRGALSLTYPGGDTQYYGQPQAAPIQVTLSDPDLPRRLLLAPDLALGEGYMDGHVCVGQDDLEGLLTLGIANRDQSGTLTHWAMLDRLGKALRWTQQHNPLHKARANVAHHYDLSGALYDLFLDADRQYSCAYFPTGRETLADAQAAKKDHIARKLAIRPGDHVLDIGCGWGGMALTLARDYGARVTGITLSEEQHRIATERVLASGLDDRIEIRLQDYRQTEGPFDRIVSVGMFEHVGAPHYRTYFRKVRDLLTDEGIALIHTIGRSAPPRATSPWITKYIFPGGYVPSMSEVTRAIENERLWIADVEVWRLHYARTLKHWYDRFTARRAEAASLYDDRFVRMWRYYLKASEVTFRAGWQAVFQFQLSRKIDTVPVTRNYLYGDNGIEN